MTKRFWKSLHLKGTFKRCPLLALPAFIAQAPAYPDLVQVPGYPVYYAPRVNENLFFYDGQYWV